MGDNKTCIILRRRPKNGRRRDNALYAQPMLFDLPDDDTLYAALCARDKSYEDQAFVGVASTGIFCRLSCPAPTAHRKNCTFYSTIAACFQAGYRPCKRCDPTGAIAAEAPQLQHLLEALEKDPARRWREADVEKMGYDLSTTRRLFKRHFGMTFLEMARLSRLRQGFTELSRGGRVIDAQVEAGFESASAFREYFTQVTGLRPSDLNGQGGIVLQCCDTPVGPMIIAADQTHLHLLEFVDRRSLPREMQNLHRACRGNMGFGSTPITEKTEQQLTEFFAGERPEFDLPLALHGTEFTKRVWRVLCDIPAGQTRSYAQLAQMIDNPTATRAVARANGTNQIAIVIPCHRVIGADGSLTGYGGGLWRKQKLLEVERAYRAAQ